MTYEWTDAEKRDMRHGTPLLVSGRVVFFQSAEDGACCYQTHGGVPQSCSWHLAAPVVTAWAPPLGQQERELFESRCKELGQTRSKLDELHRLHIATAQTLSHMVHKDREKDERIAKLTAKLAAARLAAAAASVPGVVSARVIPPLDESGEPAAGDYVATPPKTPGELAKVGDTICFEWPGGHTFSGRVEDAGVDHVDVRTSDSTSHLVSRMSVLEILPEVSP